MGQGICIDPFADFMGRTDGRYPLFVLFYKFGDALGGTMANPFYIEMGYSGVRDLRCQQGGGIWMTIVGALIGGVAVASWGVFRALLIGGILQAVTNFAFAYVAMRGTEYGLCAKSGRSRSQRGR
jgi:PAT family beta-lactamase induction signal transducer AmpG